MDNLIKTFSSLEETRKGLDYFREEVIIGEAHIRKITFNGEKRLSSVWRNGAKPFLSLISPTHL